MDKETDSIRFFVSILPDLLILYQKKLGQFKREAIHPFRETRRS